MRKLTTAIAAALLIAALVLGPAPADASRGHGHRVTVLTTTLDGAQEISPTGMPGAGDPDGRGFALVVGTDRAPTTLCYVLAVRRIAPAAAAHIHMAPAGANGPIVVHLTPPADGFSADCVTEGDLMPNGMPVFTGGATASQILADPAGFYVNVHNADFPAGAIRGQLHGL
jgi:hypothetical protein